MLSLCKRTFTSSIQRSGVGRRRVSAKSVLNEGRANDVPFRNEPVLEYRRGSAERCALETALERLLGGCDAELVDVPLVIGGEEVRGRYAEERVQKMPHDRRRALATYRWATCDQVREAADAAVAAGRRWDRDTRLDERVRVWLRAADLLAGKYRPLLNATTMLGQGKTCVQAEIDSACELVDFVRAAASTLVEASRYSPLSPQPSVTLNSMRYRGMEGFVAAVTPFNFTAIGGNLAFTPALAGNGVLWKPSDTAVLSNWVVWRAMIEAGVPRDLVNFVPCDGPTFGDTVTADARLSAVSFTGSAPTFRRLWRQVGENVDRYRNFPKLVGECGGKNFHLVHRSADVRSVVTATIRSAFEYQGQKCSACSRIYVPRSLWPDIECGLLEERARLVVGPPTDFAAFMTAVIDGAAFARIRAHLERAACGGDGGSLRVLGGGGANDACGWYVEPTIVLAEDAADRVMREEIFGPVLACHVYDDANASDDDVFRLVDESTPYALTGAVFGQDRAWLERAATRLRWASGNFYVNDKSTGSVVGQQPFGGARISGTNDKAGGPHYVLKWTTPQAIKETFVPLRDIDYPYMRD